MFLKKLTYYFYDFVDENAYLQGPKYLASN